MLHRASGRALPAACAPHGGGGWTTLWTLSSEPYGNAFAAKSKVLSLGAFAGQTVDIAFRAVGTKGADFSLDDFAVGAFLVSQPPSNDQCSNAAQLPSGSFNLSGATCSAANDMDPSNGTTSACIGYEMDGPDVFYKFNVGVGDSLTASVHGGWGPGLYVMKSCSGASSDCLAGSYYEDSELDPSVAVVPDTTNNAIVRQTASGLRAAVLAVGPVFAQ